MADYSLDSWRTIFPRIEARPLLYNNKGLNIDKYRSIYYILDAGASVRENTEYN